MASAVMLPKVLVSDINIPSCKNLMVLCQGGNGVQYDLVAHAHFIEELAPGIKIVVVIGHDSVCFLPLDHGRIMDVIGGINLPGPRPSWMVVVMEWPSTDL